MALKGSSKVKIERSNYRGQVKCWPQMTWKTVHWTLKQFLYLDHSSWSAYLKRLSSFQPIRRMKWGANENSPHWIFPIKIFFLDTLRFLNVKFFGFRFVNNSIMNRICFNKYTFLRFQILVSDWLIHDRILANQLLIFKKPALIDKSFYSKTSRFTTFLFTILCLTFSVWPFKLSDWSEIRVVSHWSKFP